MDLLSRCLLQVMSMSHTRRVGLKYYKAVIVHLKLDYLNVLLWFAYLNNCEILFYLL